MTEEELRKLEDVEIIRETKSLLLIKRKFDNGFLYEILNKNEDGTIGRSYFLSRSKRDAINRFHLVKYFEKQEKEYEEYKHGR